MIGYTILYSRVSVCIMIITLVNNLSMVLLKLQSLSNCDEFYFVERIV
jgi:hypothetical protein